MPLFPAAFRDEYSQSKLEALYARYSKDMFRVAYGILNDYHLAEDAVQSAFINLSACLNKIEDMNCNKTRAFVVIIVRNISINLYRKRKKQNDIALEDIENIFPDGGVPVDERIINAEMFNRVSAKIQELNTVYSDIISLKYFYHYSDIEIAKMLNITQENARVRLHRARQSLIKLLSREGELSKK